MKSWGNNCSDQLGDGTWTDFRTTATTGHGPALLTDQTVVAWGRNNHGQLGNGTNADSSVPVTALAALTGADKIAAPVGGDFSLAN